MRPPPREEGRIIKIPLHGELKVSEVVISVQTRVINVFVFDILSRDVDLKVSDLAP